MFIIIFCMKCLNIKAFLTLDAICGRLVNVLPFNFDLIEVLKVSELPQKVIDLVFFIETNLESLEI